MRMSIDGASGLLLKTETQHNFHAYILRSHFIDELCESESKEGPPTSQLLPIFVRSTQVFNFNTTHFSIKQLFFLLLVLIFLEIIVLKE